MFTKAAKIFGRGRNFLNQDINKMWTVQNKNQYTAISEQQYLDTWRIENSKKFPYNTIFKPINIASEEEKQEFLSIFPEIVESLVNAYTDNPELRKQYTEMIYENVGKSKQDTGSLVSAFYKVFEDPQNVTPENIRLANILGWCVNLLLTSSEVLDDIMDSSENRFGKPCWYKRKHVGMAAINDGVIIENGAYLVLKKYFSGHHCYLPTMEWFHDVTVKTLTGQTLDLDSKNEKLETFTESKYIEIAKNKSIYPLLFLPVNTARLLATKYDCKLHKQVIKLSFEMGLYYMTQNDVLDCYGDPTITGKEGNDIREGKYSWPIMRALQVATPAQKEILSKHYGRSDYESELKVRVLFDELNIVEEFLSYEKKSYKKVREIIQQFPKELHEKFFQKLVDTMYY